ncbi:MAG: hypothetical protein HY675_04710, partial [Chloroflexi bacterium]|nr:hypothetical protein [Chloroflexota bacterium]
LLVAGEPSPRYGHSMVNLNGKVYLFGGATAYVSDTLPISSSAGVSGYVPASMLLNDIFASDPDPTIWAPEEPANNPPPARKNHSAVALGEKMYILFGEGDGGLLQDIWMYDPLSRLWQEQVVSGLSKPAARTGHSTVAMFGQIFVYGGRTAEGAVNDLWAFNTGRGSNTWTQRANGGIPVYGHRAVANDTGGKMYVLGGYNDDFRNDLLSYDLNTNTWENIVVEGDRPSRRAFPVATFSANKITIATGRGYNSSGVVTDLDDTWEFDTVAVNWAPKAKVSPHSFSSAVVIPRSPFSAQRELQNLGLAPRTTPGTAILFFGGLRDGRPIAETFEYTGQYLFRLPMVFR